MSVPELPAEVLNESSAHQAVMRKVTKRLIPFLFMLYIVAYLDRTNVSVAALTMKKDLHFSATVFGAGMGIFFLGYFIFEIPSNLILERVGARRWIARIMFTWGLIAMAMIFVHDRNSFYGMRLLLGAAEAGFFPGVILYLSYWYTRRERAGIIATFMTATAISNVIGPPISGALLDIHGLGLQGWQWLFVLEGLPAVLLCFVVLAYLPDGPHDARWLDVAERAQIQERLVTERQRNPIQHSSLRDAIRNPYVWQLGLLYLLLVIPQYGLVMWLPQIVKEFHGLTNSQVGLVSAIPYTFATVSMVLVARHSDRTGERRLHVAIPAFIGGVSLLASVYLPIPWMKLAMICVFAASMWATLGPFWTLPTSVLGGTAAAGGIALINSVGNLGGYVGPQAVGYVNDITHTFTYPLMVLSGVVFLGFIVALCVRRE